MTEGKRRQREGWTRDVTLSALAFVVGGYELPVAILRLVRSGPSILALLQVVIGMGALAVGVFILRLGLRDVRTIRTVWIWGTVGLVWIAARFGEEGLTAPMAVFLVLAAGALIAFAFHLATGSPFEEGSP